MSHKRIWWNFFTHEHGQLFSTIIRFEGGLKNYWKVKYGSQIVKQQITRRYKGIKCHKVQNAPKMNSCCFTQSLRSRKRSPYIATSASNSAKLISECLITILDLLLSNSHKNYDKGYQYFNNHLTYYFSKALVFFCLCLTGCEGC